MVHIRTDREISLIAASCQIVADTLNMLSDHINPGVRIIDLDKMAEEFIFCLLYTSPSPRDRG